MVRRALTRFVAAGVVALVVVGVGVWWAARNAAEREAVNDARQRTITLAQAAVGPSLTDQLVTGSPGALRRFDAIVRERVLGDGVLRVKLWTRDGRIVYSDRSGLIGKRYPLDDEEQAVFRTGRAAAEESDMSRAENRLDRAHGSLLEVYMPVRTPGGVELLFETYQTRSAVATRRSEVLAAFAPITLAGLGVLLMALVPVAWSLARRLEQARAEREQLLRHALEASTTERRRIAAHLHDGMVQSMAGASYALTGVADCLESEEQPWAASVVHHAAAELRQNVRALRSLLVEIYPPSLRRAGLGPALSDLTAQLTSREIEVVLGLPELPDLDADTEAVLFRVAQEAVRNIVKHAEAGRVEVTLECSGDTLTLCVADDGKGFAASEVDLDKCAARGHIGLSLLIDAVREVGGSLTLDSAPGVGTTVTARVPRR